MKVAWPVSEKCSKLSATVLLTFIVALAGNYASDSDGSSSDQASDDDADKG